MHDYWKCEGFIYFIQEEALLNIKIGFTSGSPLRRLRVLGTSTSQKLAGGDQPSVTEPGQADQGVGGSKPAVIAAVCELQCLCDKFDLANSAASELYVKAAVAFKLAVDPFF